MMGFSFMPDGEISKTALVFIADVVIIFFVIWLVFRKRKSKQSHEGTQAFPENKKPTVVITSRDIRAIAGDDVMVTQLDLARAYLELGKKKLAKQILDHVIKHGNPQQQQSARQLMAGF